MKIAVLSARPGSGNTTVTAMLAQAVAVTQNLEVMLTYSGLDRYIAKYVDAPTVVDKTCSLSQIVKLLSVNAIEPKNFYEYSIKLQNNLYLMDTADPSLTEQQAATLLAEVYSNSPADVTFCDLSHGADSVVAQTIIKCSDLVIMVAKAGLRDYDQIVDFKNGDLYPKDKPILLVVNEYDPQIGSLREISSRLGYKYVDVFSLHNSPYITKLSSNKNLLGMAPYIYTDKLDPRFLELRTDMQKLIKRILQDTKHKFTWEVGE